MVDKNLIIIASQPRSGSTLLQALLSNNNEVATVSEPWLLLPFLTYNRPDLINAKYSSALAASGIKDFKTKTDNKLFNEQLANFLLSQYSQTLKNEKFVLDKTPRYYEILDEIIEYFPNAKIIVLKRNPFAVLSSIIKTWNNNNLNKLLDFKRDILQAPFLLQAFAERQKNNPNVFVVSYEEIINEPSKHIEQLYDWIGINYNSDVLNYSKNKKFIGNLGDPIGVHKNSLPNKDSLQKWHEVYYKKEWKDFFTGYSKYLSEDFLKNYGNYNDVKSGCETKIFNHYLERANWSVNEFDVPLRKLIRNNILRKIKILKY